MTSVNWRRSLPWNPTRRPITMGRRPTGTPTGTNDMFGFFKDKFEKEAQAAIERRARQSAPAKAVAVAKAAARPAATAGPGEREAAIARMQAMVQTPERQALIKNAMAVVRAKRQILDELDDESRAKLVAMAITALMRK